MMDRSYFEFTGSEKVVVQELFGSVFNSFTYELWVKPEANHAIDKELTEGIAGIYGRRYVIVPGYGSDPQKAGIGISVGKNGISVYEHSYRYLPALLVYPIDILDWVHIAVVYKERTPHLYVNGELVKEGLVSPKELVSASGIFGAHDSYGSFIGKVREIRLWDHIRSEEQIRAYMNEKLTGKEHGLFGFWNFSVADGACIKDLTENGNHGTLIKPKVISTQFMRSLVPPEPTFKPTENITKYQKKLLISTEAGGNPNSSSDGIYELDLNVNSAKLLFKGNFAGLKKFNNRYYILNRDLNQIWILDHHLHLVLKWSLNFSNINDLHGLELSDDGYIYIVCTNSNKVLVLNQTTMKKEDELILTNEFEDYHHINDICLTDDSLYLSMFSISDRWRAVGFTDGAIVKFDRKSLRPVEVVAYGLSAPHSVQISEDHLFFCDSHNLNVSMVNLHSKDHVVVAAQFHGFTRGMFVDKDILIVGQSKMRNLNLIEKRFNNIANYAGIHIFDLKSNISKFIPLPATNVYGLTPI